MEVWFTEDQTKHLRIGCRVREVLFSGQSPFQKVAVLDTVEFGRMLTLDNVIQTNIKDEFVYHEMITHVGLNTHPDPKKVLVIGGGDGGAVREIVKHKGIEKVVHVEIDQMVIDVAKKFFPELSSGFNDPRVEIVVDDGIKHVKENKGVYDMIIVDSTDPVGPAVGLFSEEFYRSVFEALTGDGLFVAQTESPFFNSELITRVNTTISGIFPVTRLFWAVVPTYPGGYWTFTMGSKKHDPLAVDVDKDKIEALGTKWYSPEVHRTAFVLQPFVKELLPR
ncbi:polyamine aminopropyltransferase [Desulfallas thermosapovorans]|uniref:Polyamine aminopropyltransferase n=1 Tax=Desulfallas thermosapovorans DSM 6562 TaxID=1121431 RepID=A0A5S4ZNN2_9FIRM|nr:polyamine aminopropyltransferase [Desulfallas thermosapovorans]TYO93873.1 spermidine synthase [Desulfallas thermosapovorans DSM 6562]